MPYINADGLLKIKFHPLPYQYVIPSDVDKESYVRGWNDVIDGIIEGMPTADVVERKKGKWIWMGDKGDSRFMCSVCKWKEEVPTCMGVPSIWGYCPSCGADLREESDNGRLD